MSEESALGTELVALRNTGGDLSSPPAVGLLRRALADRANRIVARAADMIADAELPEFENDLIKAYRRLLINPLKKDPGCLGKTAIVRALVKTSCSDVEFYRSEIVYEQPEPVWGGQADSAAEIRAACAAGLVHCAASLEVLNRCAHLLGDSCKIARVGAARAIGALGADEGTPLLRLKLSMGDSDAEVVGECCAALLRLDRENGDDAVIPLLASTDVDVCIQAGLALGESRHPRAWLPLRAAWGNQFDPSARSALLLAIALLRSDEANAFLLSLIAEGDPVAAAAAIKALKIYGELNDLRTRVAEVLAGREDDELRQVFAKEWGSA